MTAEYKQPHQYRQRTLFAVIGMTPQIVTESLYALAVKQQPAFIPTQIKVITTSLGAERVRLDLLSETSGWFHRFCQDYKISSIQFSESDIQLLTRTDGSVIEDIREPEDNQLMADAITEAIRALTSEEDSAVHVSIAGGRKTMSYYAGYALSLFGREQDRLSHVLVERHYESHINFYYTTPRRQVIHMPDGRPLDTSKADITLAEIPFVSLRHGMPEDLLKGKSTFLKTIETAKKALEPVHLRIDLGNKCIHCGTEKVVLQASQLAFYAWLAERKLTDKPGVRWGDSDNAAEYLAVYKDIVATASGSYGKIEKSLKNGMDEEFFEQKLSRTKTALKNALGVPKAKSYTIQGQGRRGETRYQLVVAPQNIEFI